MASGTDRGNATHGPALGSAREGEPQVAKTYAADDTGVGDLQSWAGYSCGRPAVAVLGMPADGYAESPRFSGWDASPVERCGKKADREAKDVRRADARWFDTEALFWAILIGVLTAVILFGLCGSDLNAQCVNGSCGSSSPVVVRPGWRSLLPAPVRVYPPLGLRFVGYQGLIGDPAPVPPSPQWGQYRTEWRGSVVTIWGRPDPQRAGYIQWMPSYEPNQLILARARLFGEALASQ